MMFPAEATAYAHQHAIKICCRAHAESLLVRIEFEIQETLR
jgi:hypothetical protein